MEFCTLAHSSVINIHVVQQEWRRIEWPLWISLHFSHCRYCIPIHQAAQLSRADPRISKAFLYCLSTDIRSVYPDF